MPSGTVGQHNYSVSAYSNQEYNVEKNVRTTEAKLSMFSSFDATLKNREHIDKDRFIRWS